MECRELNQKTVVLTDRSGHASYCHRMKVDRALYVGAKVWLLKDGEPLRHGVIQHWIAGLEETDKVNKYTGEDTLWSHNCWVRWDDNPHSMSQADSRYLVIAEVQ